MNIPDNYQQPAKFVARSMGAFELADLQHKYVNLIASHEIAMGIMHQIADGQPNPESKARACITAIASIV